MSVLQVPSGIYFDEEDLDLVRRFVEVGLVRYSPQFFTFASGLQHLVYVSGRDDMTLNPDVEWGVGRKIAQTVCANIGDSSLQPCLIGIPSAGHAFAGAGAMVGFCEGIITPRGQTVCHLTMKEVRKIHGVHSTWVNGEPSPQHSYWLVDNVATDGNSKVGANRKLVESGFLQEQEFASLLVFIDHQVGAMEKLRAAGFTKVITCYKILDIIFAFGELKLWKPDQVRRVQDYIASVRS